MMLYAEPVTGGGGNAARVWDVEVDGSDEAIGRAG